MKGGGLDYTVVMIVLALNLIAYISVKDWVASAILVAGAVASQAVPYKAVVVFLAVLFAALSRTVYVEGMTSDKEKEKDKDTEKNTEKVKQIPTPLSGKDKLVVLEGLTEKADKLADKQQDLFGMLKDLGPMMTRAESMMEKLPPGFLEEAMKNFNNKKE